MKKWRKYSKKLDTASRKMAKHLPYDVHGNFVIHLHDTQRTVEKLINRYDTYERAEQRYKKKGHRIDDLRVDFKEKHKRLTELRRDLGRLRKHKDINKSEIAEANRRVENIKNAISDKISELSKINRDAGYVKDEMKDIHDNVKDYGPKELHDIECDAIQLVKDLEKEIRELWKRAEAARTAKVEKKEITTNKQFKQYNKHYAKKIKPYLLKLLKF